MARDAKKVLIHSYTDPHHGDKVRTVSLLRGDSMLRFCVSRRGENLPGKMVLIATQKIELTLA